MSFASRATRFSLFFASLICAPVFGKTLLNGIAIYNELGNDQFIAGIYTPVYTQSADTLLQSGEEKKLVIKILYDRLSMRRFKRMWIEGMAINSSPAKIQIQAENMANFSNMLDIDLQRRDILVVEKTQDAVLVSVNNIALGSIADSTFFESLLLTFVGYVPLSSQFRGDLLTGGDFDKGLQDRYEKIRPDPARISAILASLDTQKVAESLVSPDIVAPTTATAPSNKASRAETTTKPTPTILLTPSSKKTAKIRQTGSTPKLAKISPPPPKDEKTTDSKSTKFTAENILEEQLYYSALTQYTQKYARYPKISMARGQEGSVLMRVTIDRKGLVRHIEVIEETDFKALNTEARKSVKRASPFPPMPKGITDTEFSFTFLLTFNL